MIPLSIPSASEVYKDASDCEIIRHWVDHPGVAEVSRSLRGLVQSLGDDATDEFWQRTLGPLRRIAFALVSTPLPFAHVATACKFDSKQLHRLVHQSEQMFPDFHDLLKGVVLGLEQLLIETDSPYVNPLESLHQNYGSISIVLRNPRMNRAVGDFFAATSNLRNAKVVNTSQLRGSHQCTALVAIGPCGWFPEFIFSAPRAATVHVVSYSWIRDSWKPGPVFLHASDAARSSHSTGAMPRISAGSATFTSAPEDLYPPDVLPPLPQVFGVGASFDRDSRSEINDEVTPARLCHLSGGRAVFVAADEGASSLVIDPSEIGRAVVRRVPVDELEHGLYLLLRTSGGGDFIAPLADRILGPTAAKRRSEQAQWKDSLYRAAVARFGSKNRRELSSLVCSALHSLGLSQARPANVHYWMSSKCIRPRKIEDFAAILKFAGHEAMTEGLWSAMGEIDRAHRRAGHLIRRMLLQKITETSLEPLQRDGEMNFELGDQDGGSLSAYEITDMLPQEFEISTDRIGILLDAEE
jgi:hypothetical protein